MAARDILFLIIFFGALPFCLFRPMFGILMWTVVSLLSPHAFTWNVIYDFPWALLVAVPNVWKRKSTLSSSISLRVISTAFGGT